MRYSPIASRTHPHCVWLRYRRGLLQPPPLCESEDFRALPAEDTTCGVFMLGARDTGCVQDRLQMLVQLDELLLGERSGFFEVAS